MYVYIYIYIYIHIRIYVYNYILYIVGPDRAVAPGDHALPEAPRVPFHDYIYIYIIYIYIYIYIVHYIYIMIIVNITNAPTICLTDTSRTRGGSSEEKISARFW